MQANQPAISPKHSAIKESASTRLLFDFACPVDSGQAKSFVQPVQNKGLYKSPNLAAKNGFSYEPNYVSSIKLVHYPKINEAKLVLSGGVGKKKPPKRKEGEQISQDRLTGYAKRQITLAAKHYQQLVNEEKEDCSFISLTYRRLTPTDEQAKKHLESFIKRVKRVLGENFDYTWVAEMQNGKLLDNSQPSYRMQNGAVIHFHLLTPERLHRQLHKAQEFVNTAWNEVVLNDYTKRGVITQEERKTWQDELQVQNIYNEALCRFRNNQSTYEPIKPEKSTFLLFPNLTIIDSSIQGAGQYMTSYLKKNSDQIRGNMWAMSSKTHELIAPDVSTNEIKGVLQADAIMSEVTEALTLLKLLFFATPDTEENYKVIWTPHADKLIEIYKRAVQGVLRPEPPPKKPDKSKMKLLELKSKLAQKRREEAFIHEFSMH
jgi:hypothetical protein